MMKSREASIFTAAAILTAVLCFSGNLLAYSGGTGEPNNPYKIASVADFNQLSATPTHWNKSFILTADINLTGLTFTQAPIAPDTSTSSGFQGTDFTGIFDGNGHVISNLTITTSTQGYIGLFGWVGTGGQIRNLGVENVNIEGYDFVGGLVGYNYYGTLSSCYANGLVAGNSYVGGLVGKNYYNTLSSCYANGLVAGNSYVGGLIGYNDHVPLTDCYATGSVTGTGSFVGGMIGYNNGGTLTSCHATGSVSGGSDIGGLVGYNLRYSLSYRGTITGCYATGSVSGTSGVGGLVGRNGNGDYTGGTLTTCHATGSVTGNSSVGGLVGVNGSSVTGCYATGSVSGGSDIGGLVGYLEWYNSYDSLTSCYATGSVIGT
jgi:hypothetical protein